MVTSKPPGDKSLSPSRGLYSARTLWCLYALASASLLTTLTMMYVGEEGVYTITSLEMWWRKEFIFPTLYGGLYSRPPLLNWLIIPIANIMGWENVLAASRIVTASSTVLTGLVLGWLVHRLSGHRAFSAFCAMVFATGDVLFKRGWLAYADSTFSLFVFSAIACLWVASKERRHAFLIVGLLSISAAFLTKVLTCYLFYGVAFAVLALRRENRRFLLSPLSVVLHLAALGFPVLWSVYISGGVHGPLTLKRIAGQFEMENLIEHLSQIVSYPAYTLLRLLPTSLLALYLVVRRRVSVRESLPPFAFTALWILAINYLPYWMAPQSHIRYIMPLYPLFALVIASVIWAAGREAQRVAVVLLSVVIALRFIAGIWFFPYYEMNYRGGDYQAVAEDIIERTEGFPLYVADVTATGLSVTANIDVMRLPEKPITHPPKQWTSGFVISPTENPELGRVIHRYEFARRDLYLLRRGQEREPPAEK